MKRRNLLALLSSLFLLGCSKKKPEAVPLPVPFTKYDRCHICGMVILNYQGPKAEVFIQSEKEPLKFCCVKDAMTFVLQPENTKRVVAVYVTDMSDHSDKPFHEKLLDAKKAIFVADSDVTAAMGRSILPFPTQEAAFSFQKEHGGKVLSYEQITLDVIKSLKGR